ncbi:MAG: ATP-binding protein, partial [Anaerovoracaceae bacterium]
DVLDMSKIENAKVVLKVEPTDIDALFHSVSAAVSPIMKEKEIQFSLKVIKPEVPLTLSLDILRVKQIFINLLSNGAKFTPNQGRVNCTVNILPQSDTTAQLQIVVEDNGIGMSEEFQEQMFEPFAQEHQDHSGGSLSGTGLGLAIVKRLVDLMDGTITVSSTLGKGTTFTLALKVASTPVGIEAPPTPEEKKNALAGKRILLCEDHPMNIEITSRLLSKKGILFDVAENGALGLERFSASSPNYYDGILMDILMPVMDGLTATEKIRQLDRPDAKTIPIIAMTANAFDEDVEKSIEAGMNAHLTKPVSPQMLYAALEKL